MDLMARAGSGRCKSPGRCQKSFLGHVRILRRDSGTATRRRESGHAPAFEDVEDIILKKL